MVVLVAVRDDAALDAVGVVAEVGEVGQDEVDAEHVGVGEHQPAVEDHDATVDLDARAVPPDLTEPAEEGDLDGLSHAACSRLRAARSSRPAGAGPMGRRHWPAGWPRARIMALAGIGFGVRSPPSKSHDSSSSALSSQALVWSPRSNAAIISLISGAAQCAATEMMPDRADRHHRQRPGVVAGVDLEVGRGVGHGAGRLGGVGRRVLQADDVGHLVSQAHEHLVADLAARPDRDVVEQHRQVGRPGDGPEVRLEPRLRRTVVVRRHDQHRVDPVVGGPRGQLAGMAGVVRPRAGDQRHVDRGPHRLPHRDLLVVGEHRRLAGRPGHDEGVVALGDQPLGQGGGALEVDATVLVERGDHGGDQGSEARHQVASCAVGSWPVRWSARCRAWPAGSRAARTTRCGTSRWSAW